MDITIVLNRNTVPSLLGVIAISYIIGSLNFALIVCRLLGKEDIRNFGSGNAGMTNMLRTYGKTAAVLTTLGDFTKGMIAVFIGRIVFNMLGVTAFDVGYIAGFFAMIGHLYPVFFKFKGGKGVLTAFGIVMILNPLAFTILFVIFVPMAFITRIVSLASVLGVACFPFLNYFILRYQGKPYYFAMLFSLLLVGFVLYSHRDNIKRLLNGTERKFGDKPKNEEENNG